MRNLCLLLFHLFSLNRTTPYIPNEELVTNLQRYNATFDKHKINYYNTILYENNYGWIKNMAQDLSRNKDTVDDLIQSGSIGLLVSAGKYNTTANVQFITYSTFWIRAYMYSHIRSNRLIRVPDYMHKHLKHFKDVEQTDFNSFKELVGDSNINVNNLWAALQYSGFLYNDISNKGIITHIENEADTMIDALYCELERLPIDEQELVYARYLSTDKNQSYKNIAMLYGQGRETLRKRVKAILRKLSRNLI